jgi:hypothetical protein
MCRSAQITSVLGWLSDPLLAAGLTVPARGRVSVVVRKLLGPGLVLGKTIRLVLGATFSGFDIAVVKPRMAHPKGQISIVSRHGT